MAELTGPVLAGLLFVLFITRGVGRWEHTLWLDLPIMVLSLALGGGLLRTLPVLLPVPLFRGVGWYQCEVFFANARALLRRVVVQP